MNDVDLAVAEAQARLLAAPKAGPTESLPIAEAWGRICARDLRARWPLPPWDLSSMDGYAFPRLDPEAIRDPLSLRVIGESSAGRPFAGQLKPGECVRISTGAVLPDGCDQVLPQEEAIREGPNLRITPDAHPKLRPGRFVRPRGRELAVDHPILRAGERLELGHISLLAASGHPEVEVYARPRVAILSTGDELIEIGQTPQRGQTIATNALMLRLQCEAAGAVVVTDTKVPDDRQQSIAAFAQCEAADLILSCGGISVGPHDHVLPSLEALGWSRLFRKVQLQPGRPTTAGRLGSAYVLALPGNPASSYVTFELFVRPLIQALLGRPPAQWWRPQRQVHLDSIPVSDPKRDHYIRARVFGDRATPLSIQNSGALASLCGHNALICIPKGHQPRPETRYRSLLLLSHDTEAKPSDASPLPPT